MTNDDRKVPDARLLLLREVATHCAVSLRTVHTWVAGGRLRVLRLGKRCVRVEPAELNRLLREAGGEGRP